MIHIECAQGSVEWYAARLGIPTASRFSDIITDKTLKLSATCTRYAHELIASEILGYDVQSATSGFMERGAVLEKKAVDFYELQHDRETHKVGFVLRDDRRVGCSPDRFVGDDGLLEIKCPSAAVHIGYLLDEDIGYRAQVQGQLWITGRAWCDTLSYNPDLPSAIVREERDEPFIKALADTTEQFINYVGDLKAKLVHRGYFPELAVPALRIA